jgi:hypothetical protein
LERCKMSDIFLSYATADRDRAKSLAHALERQGWSVWWDRKIPPGRTFDEVIEEAIKAARCVIVMWSETSVSSKWVRTEASEGERRGILVPVLIDEVEIPLAFRRIEAAQLADWDGISDHPEFNILLESVERLVGPPSAGELDRAAAGKPEAEGLRAEQAEGDVEQVAKEKTPRGRERAAAESRWRGSTKRVKVAIVSACAVVLAALTTALVARLLREPPPLPPQEISVPEEAVAEEVPVREPVPPREGPVSKRVPKPKPQEVAGVHVKIMCEGLIHDADLGDRFDEEHFRIDRTIGSIPPGTSERVEASSRVVGGEIRLDMKLELKATKEGEVGVSGSLEFWEGEFGLLGLRPAAVVQIPETVVSSPGIATVYNDRIVVMGRKKPTGDWANVKLCVRTEPFYRKL